MKSIARPCSRRPHSSSRPRVGGLPRSRRSQASASPRPPPEKRPTSRRGLPRRWGTERSFPSHRGPAPRPCRARARARARRAPKARDDHERRLPVRSSRLMRSQRRSRPRSDEGGVRVVATVRPRVGGKNEDGAIFAASWVAARPARVRRRRLPDTSATRPHATRVPLLRARVARARMRRRSEPVAKRPIARRSQNRRAMFPNESGRASRTRAGRLTRASRRCAGRATRCGARRGPRSRARRTRANGSAAGRGRARPKWHGRVFGFWDVETRIVARSRALEKGSSGTKGSSQRNRAAAPRRGGRGEKWHGLQSQCTSCVSRRDCRRRTARASTTRQTRRAREPHAPPFSAHPVFGPSRGVGRPVRPATARRDDTGDTQARIRRMRLFASVRARLQRDRRSSPRASRASPRGSFKLTLVTGAFRSRSNASGEKKGARARGDPRREPGRLHESARRLRRRVRSEPAWRPSRDSRRRRGARLAEPNERSRGRTTKRIFRGTRAPKTSVPCSLQVLLKVKKTLRAAVARRRPRAAFVLEAHLAPARRARVSVPRPTPRGDELWLAQRMREVGGRVSSREREATEARGKARASVFGGRRRPRAAACATRGEVHRDGKRSENAPESRSSAAESPTSLSSRVSSQTRTFRSPSVTSSGRVTFTVTPSPFDPRVRRRILLTKTKKKPPRTATNATTRNVALARRLSRASTRSSPPTPPRGTSRVPTRVPTAKRQQSAP